MPPKDTLKLSLLDNGLDSIKFGIRVFANPSSETVDFKHSFSAIYQGLLLIMKHKLSLAHPTLIFRDVSDKTSKTVDFDNLLKRLKECADVQFPPNEMKALRASQKLRNLFEHYEFDLSKEEASSHLNSLLTIAYRFLQDQLGMDLEKMLKPDYWDRVVSIEELSQERKNRILNRGGFDGIAICDWCYSEAFIYNWHDMQGECLDCHLVSKIERCSECYSPAIFDGWGGATFNDRILCPDCRDYYEDRFRHFMNED